MPAEYAKRMEPDKAPRLQGIQGLAIWLVGKPAPRFSVIRLAKQLGQRFYGFWGGATPLWPVFDRATFWAGATSALAARAVDRFSRRRENPGFGSGFPRDRFSRSYSISTSALTKDPDFRRERP